MTIRFTASRSTLLKTQAIVVARTDAVSKASIRKMRNFFARRRTQYTKNIMNKPQFRLLLSDKLRARFGFANPNEPLKIKGAIKETSIITVNTRKRFSATIRFEIGNVEKLKEILVHTLTNLSNPAKDQVVSWFDWWEFGVKIPKWRIVTASKIEDKDFSVKIAKFSRTGLAIMIRDDKRVRFVGVTFISRPYKLVSKINTQEAQFLKKNMPREFNSIFSKELKKIK